MTAPSRRPEERADLHLHTTCSDGSYTPAQIVDLARRSGLAALAITDHDTVAGIAPARLAAGTALEIVPALELTSQWRSQDMHLLGYFVRTDDAALLEGLRRIHNQRRNRFGELVQRLQAAGIGLDETEVNRLLHSGTPTRRHLADMLVRQRVVSSVAEAFQHYLREDSRRPLPRIGLPAQEAIALIRGAGGVAVWAHPAYDCRRKNVLELRSLGLQGLEVEYPGYRTDRVKQMRQLAADLDLVISGGSDCHGPWPFYQTVGARGVTVRELEIIRQRSG